MTGVQTCALPICAGIDGRGFIGEPEGVAPDDVRFHVGGQRVEEVLLGHGNLIRHFGAKDDLEAGLAHPERDEVAQRCVIAGGVLGVVEHRAAPGTSREQSAKSGYVTESYIRALAYAAGFELAASSPVNDNPKDTKDYPEGVWTLPPVLRLKDVDRAKYVAIGESDRMTFRFVKPKAKR